MATTTPTNFHTKSSADKCVSYLWYIHVLIAVNTEARLRANIAPHLLNPSLTANSSSGSASSTPTTTPTATDLLTDHLLLHIFSTTLLPHLTTTAPLTAHANAYTTILAAIFPSPTTTTTTTTTTTPLHETFCARLYTLLFAKGILEWPRGIDEPAPAITAGEPFVDGCDGKEAPVELADTHLSAVCYEWRGGAGLDGAASEGLDEHKSSRAAPSVSSWDGGTNMSHMERGAYFGTASSPLPVNYFSGWTWSRDEEEAAGAMDSIAADARSVHGMQPLPPYPSPRETPANFLETSFRDIWREPPPPTSAHDQSRANPLLSMHGDEDNHHNYGSSSNVRSSSERTVTRPAAVCRFGRGRMVNESHTAPCQPIASDERSVSGSDWDEGDSPVSGHHQRWSSSYVSGRSAGQAGEGRRVRQVPRMSMSLLEAEGGQRSEAL